MTHPRCTEPVKGMVSIFRHALLFAACVLALHASCVSAQGRDTLAASTETSSSINERYPAGSIKTEVAADAALADVGKERAAIEARFTVEEQACHPKFFATSCVEQAKERKRKALANVRKVELEANSFKRREKAEERDKAVAERQSKAEADLLEREHALQGKEAEPHDAQKIDARDAERKAPAIFSDRVAEHEAKQQRLAQEEKANEAKRAENVADYEKKVKAAQERQRKIAEKKAKKEAQQRAKQTPQSGTQTTEQ